MSSVTASSRLRSRRICASRAAGSPPAPNRRSKTACGLVSIGSGMVGVRQENVFT